MMKTDISVGDKVSFTHVGRGRKTLSMTSKTGEVEAINESQVATVRTSKNVTYSISVSRLRKVGEKSTLTEFAEEVFKANRTK